MVDESFTNSVMSLVLKNKCAHVYDTQQNKAVQKYKYIILIRKQVIDKG